MRRLLALSCSIVLVDTIFFAALSPLLPRFAEELDLSKAESGLLVATYALGGVLGRHPERARRDPAGCQGDGRNRPVSRRRHQRALRDRHRLLAPRPDSACPGHRERVLLDRRPRLAGGRDAGRNAAGRRSASRCRLPSSARCSDRCWERPRSTSAALAAFSGVAALATALAVLALRTPVASAGRASTSSPHARGARGSVRCSPGCGC